MQAAVRMQAAEHIQLQLSEMLQSTLGWIHNMQLCHLIYVQFHSPWQLEDTLSRRLEQLENLLQLVLAA